MKWSYNPFDDATSRKIHSSNPFRPNFSQKGRIVHVCHLKRDWRAKRCSFIKTMRRPKSTVAMTKLRIGLWIDSSSTLFSGFGSVWLLSVPKLKNLARWEEILVKWGSHCRSQWVFCRLWDSLLRVIKWIVAPFHGNLPNLSNDPRLISKNYNFNCKFLITMTWMMELFDKWAFAFSIQ